MAFLIRLCVTAVDNQQSLFPHKRADSIDSILIQTAHITTVTSLLARKMDAERKRHMERQTEAERKEMPKPDNDAEEKLREAERKKEVKVERNERTEETK